MQSASSDGSLINHSPSASSIRSQKSSEKKHVTVFHKPKQLKKATNTEQILKMAEESLAFIDNELKLPDNQPKKKLSIENTSNIFNGNPNFTFNFSTVTPKTIKEKTMTVGPEKNKPAA
jgi:hypothetical protein